MKTYTELKAENAKELNEFHGMFFAFSEKQLTEGLEKLGVEPSLIVSIGSGGYILKSRVSDLTAMFKRHNESLKQLKKDHNALLDAIVYELHNHEYTYTRDASDALDALGLKESDLPDGLLKKAKAKAESEEFAA